MTFRSPGWTAAAIAVVLLGVVAAALTLDRPIAPKSVDQSRTPFASAPPAASRVPGGMHFSTVAFVGDSYTSGAGASSPSKRWTDLIAEDYGWTQHNLSKGGTGYVTAGRLAGGNVYADRIDELVAAQPDLVILTGGRNDLGSTVETVAAAAHAFVADIQGEVPEARIVIINPLWDDDPVPSVVAELAAGLRQVASETGATFVSVGQPLVGHPELLTEDSVHPNDAGYAAIAKATTAALTAAGIQH